MRLISKKKLLKATSKYSDVTKQKIEDLYQTLKKAKWKNLEEVKRDFSSSAEAVENFTVINIKGNTYRLILDIIYEKQVIYFKDFLTHAEYDKGKWKNDRHFNISTKTSTKRKSTIPTKESSRNS